MNSQDLYEVLGLSRGAEQTVVAAAYRALAKKYHPDTAHGDKAAAAEHFKRIQAAYEILKNESSRREYDAYQPTEFVPDEPQPAPQPAEEQKRASTAESTYWEQYTVPSKPYSRVWVRAFRVALVLAVFASLSFYKMESAGPGETALGVREAISAFHPAGVQTASATKTPITQSPVASQTAKSIETTAEQEARLVQPAVRVIETSAPGAKDQTRLPQVTSVDPLPSHMSSWPKGTKSMAAEAKTDEPAPALAEFPVNPFSIGLLAANDSIVSGNDAPSPGNFIFDFRQHDVGNADSISLSPAELEVLHANVEASAPTPWEGRIIACRVNYTRYENGLAVCRLGREASARIFRSFVCRYWQSRPCADAGLHDVDHDITEVDFPATYAQRAAVP